MATEIIPYLYYRDVPAALDWLGRAFGFEEEQREPTPGGMHASMRLDGCRIMLGQHDARWAAPRGADCAARVGIFVYVADVRAHFERARAAGAEIPQPPVDHGYGPTYTVHDLGGHPWYFTQAPEPVGGRG